MDSGKIVFYSTLVTMAFFAGSCRKHPADPQAGRIPSVDVALPVVDSVVVRSEYPGYLVPEKSVDVVARVNGYITGKHFKDGDYVRKGQALFSIEDTQYRDAVDKAAAALETARSAADYAERQNKAMKQAYASDAVSQMDVVKAENALNEAHASIKSAEAALRTAQTDLSYCTVRALADGHIAAPDVYVGDYLSGGVSPVVLTTIYDDRNVSAKISVEDSQYLKLVDMIRNGRIDMAGIPVSFNESLPHSYTGRLDYLAPSIDKSTGTMTLKVKIDNPYGELKSGMFVNVALPVSSSRRAIMVNDASLSTDQLGKFLYVVNDSDKVVYTPVKTGAIYDDTLRIVTEGLGPTDRYVTKALLKVRDGMKVRPVLTE